MSTAYAEEQQAVDTVVIDTTPRGTLAPVAQPARDNVSALLPPTPRGRDFNRIADQAKRIGERLGAVVTGEGASKAIYSFPAGNGRIEGPTVWLIGALWQEYGHVVVDSEVREERGGRIAITTTIVDRINGTAYRRDHHTALAPAPAKFARKPDQIERWNTMQLQSAISKAERTTVQHFLPGWYVDAAMDAARDAFGRNVLGKNADGSPRSLQQAINDALEAFGRDFKITQAQLEEYLDAARSLWTLSDFAEVRALFGKLKRGEATVAGVFGEPAPAQPAVTTPASAPKADGLGGLVDDDEPKPNSPADAGHTKPSEPAKRAKKVAAAPSGAPPTATAVASPTGVASPPPPRGFEPPKTMSAEELAAAGKAS